MRRDLRVLLGHIERRLTRRPSAETLDRLALLAGFQSWEAFQRELHDDDEKSESGGK